MTPKLLKLKSSEGRRLSSSSATAAKGEPPLELEAAGGLPPANQVDAACAAVMPCSPSRAVGIESGRCGRGGIPGAGACCIGVGWAEGPLLKTELALSLRCRPALCCAGGEPSCTLRRGGLGVEAKGKRESSI